MSLFSIIIIIALAFGIIISGLIILKKTAKGFNLTPEQLATIKKRNEELDKEQRKEESKNK
ncbi:DUF2897 family protein [Colwellia sp. E2M01]|uniref:DUF2897 family protein n=1 Tax=Colwellia sp. E2M01 TaxID=2841561 RepID=UPI001C08CF84|nr:DUF2897 family protein [Colwellia sp. E2M01]MBU2871576.1 DUF2897 family protein [Colwellia sp. E2M01]